MGNYKPDYTSDIIGGSKNMDKLFYDAGDLTKKENADKVAQVLREDVLVAVTKDLGMMEDGTAFLMARKPDDVHEIPIFPAQIELPSHRVVRTVSELVGVAYSITFLCNFLGGRAEQHDAVAAIMFIASQRKMQEVDDEDGTQHTYTQNGVLGLYQFQGHPIEARFAPINLKTRAIHDFDGMDPGQLKDVSMLSTKGVPGRFTQLVKEGLPKLGESIAGPEPVDNVVPLFGKRPPRGEA